MLYLDTKKQKLVLQKCQTKSKNKKRITAEMLEGNIVATFGSSNDLPQNEKHEFVSKVYGLEIYWEDKTKILLHPANEYLVYNPYVAPSEAIGDDLIYASKSEM